MNVIDIALVGDELTLTDQAKILDAIEQTNIPQKVDIVLYRTIRSNELLGHIAEFEVGWDVVGFGFGGGL